MGSNKVIPALTYSGKKDPKKRVVGSGHLIILRGRGKNNLATGFTMWVVVLNDLETYTAILGSKILFVPASEWGDGMDQYVKENAESGGIDLSLTESVSAPLSVDIFIRNLTEIEG